MMGRGVIAIPAVAVAIAAAVLLGPGAPRPAVGMRIYGAPVTGARIVALRLLGVERFAGVDEAAALANMRVEARVAPDGTGSGQSPAGSEDTSVWEGGTGKDGVAEARLELRVPRGGAIALRVTRAGTPLAEGVVSVVAAPPKVLAPGWLTGIVSAVEGSAGGASLPSTLGERSPSRLAIRVEATRGVLAAPFAERLRVHVGDGAGGPGGTRATLSVTALGAEVKAPHGAATSPLALTADARGEAEFVLTPLAYQVDLIITAQEGDLSGRWEGSLPVTPGAIHVARGDGGALAVVSPAPRERAYLSFWDAVGRVGGAVVPLARDSSGFYRGAVTPAPPPSPGLFTVTAAGDPLELGVGTVAYPLEPAEGSLTPPRLAQILDGVPAAEARERARASAARRAALFVIVTAAALTVLLLLREGYASQRRLEAHLVAASPEGDEALAAGDPGEAAAPAGLARADLLRAARERPVLHAVIAAALVGLAFALVAALTTLR